MIYTERVGYSDPHKRCRDCRHFKPFHGEDLKRSGECRKTGHMVRALSANRECHEVKP